MEQIYKRLNKIEILARKLQYATSETEAQKIIVEAQNIRTLLELERKRK